MHDGTGVLSTDVNVADLLQASNNAADTTKVEWDNDAQVLVTFTPSYLDRLCLQGAAMCDLSARRMSRYMWYGSMYAGPILVVAACMQAAVVIRNSSDDTCPSTEDISAARCQILRDHHNAT